ncbi:DUF2710 family protein [Mycobacterium sp. M1]|uniref:DUF2710 family protein n=1 Tax=Mycolicibacter acidiphilus TaxID=2835306 RepID=A0ABS5RLB5_9MYCO|nr:DUF2710 family protein [Mycolicibacter acidiphilus]MBS9533734.1 DUF2710 family protein [Mycolicibacter acidiphilus]
MSGPDHRAETSDKDLVDAVLRDLREAAEKWEALVAEAQSVTYSVDLGDVRVVADADGRLVELALHPCVVSDYTHDELSDRLNTAFAALRDEVRSDFAELCGEPG